MAVCGEVDRVGPPTSVFKVIGGLVGRGEHDGEDRDQEGDDQEGDESLLEDVVGDVLALPLA